MVRGSKLRVKICHNITLSLGILSSRKGAVTMKHSILFAAAVGLMSAALAQPIQAQLQVWDLVADWSDVANPNGPWSYNEGNDPLPLIDPFPFGWSQPAWAPSQYGGNFLPFWVKSRLTPINADWIEGDVVTHTWDAGNGNGNGQSNVTWTSPVNGIVDISGSVWMTIDQGRAVDWILSENGITLTSGSLYSGDPWSRANPADLLVENQLVYVGDVLKLELPTASSSGDLVGVTLTVSLKEIVPEPTCAPSPAGLVSWWPAEGNAFDIQDANHGTLQNGATFGDGKVGEAFSLDGVDDYVSVPNSYSLQFTDALTIEGWVKPNTLLDPWGLKTILTKWNYPDPGYSWTFGIASWSGQLYFEASANGSLPTFAEFSDGAVQVSVWNHVAVVFNSGAVDFYINGVQNSKSVPATSLYVSYNPVHVGVRRQPNGNFYLFNGLIDELAVYSRALTQAEIQAIYDARSAGKCQNRPPVAAVDPDQAVNEGDFVMLDGSGSSDPDGDLLTFEWMQVAGIAVSLDLTDPEYPTFTAPTVPRGGATLTFQLTVSDGEFTSEPAYVNITVKNVNNPPVASVSNDSLAVAEEAVVTLDGSPSYDPDAEPITFAWVQTAGQAVTLSEPADSMPSFDAPLVGPLGELLTFELTVSDGIDYSTVTVKVLVENVNHLPTADAGFDQTVDENSPVTLDGSASSDLDGDPLDYTWSQLEGTTVALSDPYGATPTFTAPSVGPGGETLVFRLTVDDGYGGSASDEVEIFVQDTNDPPSCDLAQASPGTLWPPNHKMIPVSISGVTDPNDQSVTITVLEVTQDEPVNGPGDGNTRPDAVIQGGTVLLRAEKAGGGNGRVYHITFEADDGDFGVCTGMVTVCVPHDRKPTTTCIDDGQLYDSTQP